MSYLHRTIFDQFVAMAVKEAATTGCAFVPCHANYSVHQHQSQMDIEYLSRDECERQSVYAVILDITGICFDDLHTPSWQSYLHSKVTALLAQICPPVLPVPKKAAPCRSSPAHWGCPEAKTTTYIQCTPVPPPPHQEHVVIVECCESPCAAKAAITGCNCTH